MRAQSIRLLAKGLSNKQDDAHWILQLCETEAFAVSRSGKTGPSSSMFSFSFSSVDEEDKMTVQPVQCVPCDFTEWQLAPHRQERPAATIMSILAWNKNKRVILGRRINDEVEMFERGMKEVWPPLETGTCHRRTAL